VLGAVKDEPQGAALTRAVLDRPCARRLWCCMAGTKEWLRKGPNHGMKQKEEDQIAKANLQNLTHTTDSGSASSEPCIPTGRRPPPPLRGMPRVKRKRMARTDVNGSIFTEVLTVAVTQAGPAIVTGTPQVDHLNGGSGSDIISGGAGNDALDGGIDTKTGALDSL
jgi:RTX calcium-binding nonapeptide repeat (4 copies)